MENESQNNEVISTTRPSLLKSGDINRGSSYDYLFKVSLIGDSACGKSSIILRFTDNIFKDNTATTIGVDFKIVSVKTEETSIKLQIWDTCGSERFKSLTSSFMKSCHIFILIFDVTNYNSFKNVEGWIKLIKENTSPKLMCLVGNKIDLEDNREVQQSEAILLAEKYRMKYLETSAKANTNIQGIFVYIAEYLLNEIKKRRSVGESLENHFESKGYSIINKEQSQSGSTNKKCC